MAISPRPSRGAFVSTRLSALGSAAEFIRNDNRVHSGLLPEVGNRKKERSKRGRPGGIPDLLV